MVERVTDIREDTFVVEYMCDKCFKGSMAYTHKASALGFEHKCILCNEEQVFSGTYPFIRQHKPE